MSRHDVEGIIAEVFAVTGVKLTADDPIVAVLLMQQQSIQTALQSFERQQDDARAAFLHQLAIHEQSITEAAAELKTYRQQILTELLQQTDLQQAEIEERLFGSINQRVSKNTEQLNQVFLGRLKGYLIAACVAWAVIGLMMVAAIK